MLKKAVAFILLLCFIFGLCACGDTGDSFSSKEEMYSLINGVWEVEGSKYIFADDTVYRFDKENFIAAADSFLSSDAPKTEEGISYDAFKTVIFNHLKPDSKVKPNISNGTADWDGWKIAIKGKNVTMSAGGSRLNFKLISKDKNYIPQEYEAEYNSHRDVVLATIAFLQRIPLSEDLFNEYKSAYRIKGEDRSSGIAFSTPNYEIKIDSDQDGRVSLLTVSTTPKADYNSIKKKDLTEMIEIANIFAVKLNETAFETDEIISQFNEAKEDKGTDENVRTITLENTVWQVKIHRDRTDKGDLWREIVTVKPERAQ